jgi:hypothetical protein
MTPLTVSLASLPSHHTAHMHSYYVCFTSASALLQGQNEHVQQVQVRLSDTTSWRLGLVPKSALCAGHCGQEA